MRLLNLLVILPILFAFMASVSAQPSMPSGALPELCTAEPLTPDELTEIVEAGFYPAGSLVETDAEIGSLDVRGIALTLVVTLSCTNANQPLAALSLYTDRYLAEHFSGGTGTDELGHLLAAATRNPEPAVEADYVVLLGIEDTIYFSDGRLGTTVYTRNSTGTFIDLVLFAKVDDQWLIDQVVIGDEFIPGGTPVARSREFVDPVG